MKRTVLLVSSLATFVFLASCNDGGSPSGGEDNGLFGTIPTTPNTMVVTIDGVDQTYQCLGVKAVWGFDTMYVLAGADNFSFKGVGLGYTKIWAPGTYDIGTIELISGSPRMVTMNYMYRANAGDTVTYITQNDLTSTSAGTLKIVEISPTVLKASFHATLPKTEGFSGAPTASITKGAVYVQFAN
jgi:hypothetical protein